MGRRAWRDLLSVCLVCCVVLQGANGSQLEIIGEDRQINVNMMPKDRLEAMMVYRPDNSFSFIKNHTIVAEFNKNSWEWRVPAKVRYMKIKGSLSHRSQIGSEIRTARIWQLVHLDNFAQGEKNGWQGAETFVQSCGPSRDKLLFRDCSTKTNFVEKKFVNLPPHTELMVEMSVNFIDQWEGELAFLQLDKEIVWTKSHNWCHTIFNHKCILDGINVCNDAYPDLIGQNVKFVAHHERKDIVVRFGSSLVRNNCKATWAFNNFMLYVR